MKLAVINLTGGGMSGGYRKYLQNMLPRLAHHNEIESLLCVSPEEINHATWFKKLPTTHSCTCSALNIKHLFHIPDNKMAKCLEKFGPDIIFIPVAHYINFRDIPVVNILRNMEPAVKSIKGDRLKDRWIKHFKRNLMRRTFNHATRTIAVSNFVKDFLTGTLQIPGDKVPQIYFGVTSSFKGRSLRPVTIPNSWNKPFLFTAGSIRPARGLEDAIEALNLLKQQTIDARLVIAGDTVPGMKKYRLSLERQIAAHGLINNVCWAGNLREEEMSWCYKKCALFIMTSRIEACPNIALEAMSSGCICISTDSSPMVEFFKNAAVYYKQGDGESLCGAIQSVLSWNDGIKKELSQKAIKQASKFSWEACAEKTVAVLKLSLSKKNRHESGRRCR